MYKLFVHAFVIIASFGLGSVALADAKTQVITGRVVELDEQNITVQSGKKRVDINYSNLKYTGNPKVGDTVTVHYKPVEPHYRFDPDYEGPRSKS